MDERRRMCHGSESALSELGNILVLIPPVTGLLFWATQISYDEAGAGTTVFDVKISLMYG